MTDQVVDDPFKQTQNNLEATPPVSNDPFANQLKGIVDDTGRQKYETTDKALEALGHSQQHIKTLQSEKEDQEAEIKKMREELEKRATVEDFVNRFSEPKPEAVPVRPSVKEDGLDETKVAELINNTLAQKTAAELKQNNLSRVSNELSKTFGDKANAIVNAKAQELGMTVEELQNLSADKPNLVLNLFEGVDTSKPQYTIPSNTSPRNVDNTDTPKEIDSKLISAGLSTGDLLEGWGNIKKRVYDRNGVITK